MASPAPSPTAGSCQGETGFRVECQDNFFESGNSYLTRAQMSDCGVAGSSAIGDKRVNRLEVSVLSGLL